MTIEHLEYVTIEPAVLDAWERIALELEDAGRAVRLEFADVRREPSRHNLRCAARAARHAERSTTGDAATMASALATVLEEAAETQTAA